MKAIVAGSLLLLSGLAQADQAQEWVYTSSVMGNETYLPPDSPPLDSGFADIKTQALTGIYSASMYVTGEGNDLKITSFDTLLSLSDGESYANVGGGWLVPAFSTSTGPHTCGHESGMGFDGCIDFAGAATTMSFTVSFAQNGAYLLGGLGGGTDSLTFTQSRACFAMPYADATNGKDRLCGLQVSGESGSWKQVSATAAPEIDASGAGAALALAGGLAILATGRRRASRL